MRRLFSLPAEVRIPLYASFWTVCIAITLNDKFLEITHIDGSSMAPTLSPEYHSSGRKDCVAWRKWQPTRGLSRGDIVLFGNPTNPEGGAVKRVLALEGDTVLLDRRRRPSRSGQAASGVNAEPGDCVEGRNWDIWKRRVVIPRGHVWVEGDNWEKSHDSNWYGPISRNLITGKAVAVVKPWSRWGMKPWEGFRSRTKVIPARPQESPLAEIADLEDR